jgi:hypothetical protein
MNPNLNAESDPGLEAVLRRWVVDTPLPPRFKELVWHRVAHIEAPPEAGLLASLLEVVLPRPKVAWSYLAALLAIGMATGSITAQIKASHLDADLSARYVQKLDPYGTGGPHP